MLIRSAMLGALAVIAGCASQSPPVDSTPAVAAAPVVAAAPTAVAASSGQASAPVATPAQPPPGWKAKRRSGELVYCKTVDSTGSLFPQEVCLTPEELEAALATQKNNAMRTLDIPRTTPTQR